MVNVYQKYITLIQNRVLMQIYAKTVEADQEQLRINRTQFKAGTGTQFAVLQSETQLATDRQALIQQQVTVGAGPLATNGAPLEATSDAETK